MLSSGSSPRWLREVGQRLPFASNLVLLALALGGPAHLPGAYMLASLALHACLLASCLLAVVGCWSAYRGVEAHDAVDWHDAVLAGDEDDDDEKAVMSAKSVDLEADGALDPASVQHLLLLPNYQEDVATLREVRLY